MNKATTFILGIIFCNNIFSQSFSDIQNEKTFEMFNALRNNNENLFISPLGLRLSLGIYYYGIKDEYQKNQWEQYLGISDSFSKSAFNQLYDFPRHFSEQIEAINQKPAIIKKKYINSKLEISNALKYQKNITFDSSYLDFLKDSLHVTLFPFEDSESQVNTKIKSWISTNSNNRIQYFPDKSENAIINLTYFLGAWEYTFDKKDTKKRAFYTHDKKIRTETMYKKDPYSYYEDKDLQVIKLPYEGCKMSMIILCPKKKRSNITNLDVTYWKSIVNNFTNPEAVKLYLPKFSFSSEFVFNPDFFEKQEPFKSSLTGIFSRQDFSIAGISHNTFIEIDEEKTEAYAITTTIFVSGPKRKHPKPIVFKANKPFLFFIVDEQSDLILFAGKYVGE
jgi:serpin B